MCPAALRKAAALCLTSPRATTSDVRGKIVLTEGMGMPASVALFEGKGAIGQININPGVDIHWGICTTIWGAPDLDSYGRKPKIPVASVNRPDGEELKQLAQAGDCRSRCAPSTKKAGSRGPFWSPTFPVRSSRTNSARAWALDSWMWA